MPPSNEYSGELQSDTRFLEFNPRMLDFERMDVPDGVDRIIFAAVEHFRADELDLPHLRDTLKESGIILFENIGYSPQFVLERQKIANGDYDTLKRFETRERGYNPGSDFNIALAKAYFNSNAKIMPLDVSKGSQSHSEWKSAFSRSQNIIFGGNSIEEILESFKTEELLLFESHKIREQCVLDNFAAAVHEAIGHRTLKKHSQPSVVALIYGDVHLSIYNALRIRTEEEEISTELRVPAGALRYVQQAYAKHLMGEEITEDLWFKSLIEATLLDHLNGPPLSALERINARSKLHSELDSTNPLEYGGILDYIALRNSPHGTLDERITKIFVLGLKAITEKS
jgi:hypothetical protein